MTTTLAPRENQAIQAYFSHSYRAEDRDVNLFFWRLFSTHGFFFTVDPKSGRTFVPHLERMLRHSDCFIAVVTRRLELVKNIGNVALPQPQVVWNYSPYIHLENRLAFRSGKPRLIFVESGLDANLFGSPEEVHVFDRDILDKREHLYNAWVAEFAVQVQDYKRYTDRTLQPTRRAGILIDTRQEREVYTPDVLALIKEALRAGGYMAHQISSDITDDQQFIRELSDLELLISEVREPWISGVSQAFVHARFMPTIRIARLQPGETRQDVILPEFLKGYRAGDIDPIVPWRTLDELALEIVQHMQKFQQARTLLDTLDAGRRYFLSAGRRRASVFVSNAHSLNDLAMELIKGFQTVNIQFFHYQATLRIGSAWQDELKRELNGCDVFIALINDDYHTSRWCQYELECAYDRWKNHEVVILPYVVTNTKLPETIRESIQCAFSANLPIRELVATIVETVDRHLIQIEQSPSILRDRVGEFEQMLERSVNPTSNIPFGDAVVELVGRMAKMIEIEFDKENLPQQEGELAWVPIGVKRLFGNLPNFPDTIPLIISRTGMLTQAEIEIIKQWLMGQTTRVALLLAPATSEQIQHIRRMLDAQVRQVHACDVVVVNHDDIKMIVRSHTPEQALRRAVLAQVNIQNYAAFIVNGSTPDHMFFGREAELRTVCENVRVTSYAVIGGRRIGKTSLLSRLHRVRLPAVGFRTLYLDCSTVSTYEAFLNAPIRDWKPDVPPQAPMTFGNLILGHGQNRAFQSDRPLVMLLDEVDKLVPSDRANDWRLFNALRAMANSGRVQVVLGGERTLRDALRDASSPLFNFTNEMLIGRLEFHAVVELITKPMEQLNVELDDPINIVRRIYDFTSGHPNVVQRLCRRLIERLDQTNTRQLTLEIVNQALEDPDFIRKDFLETYFSRASTLEHLCALLMAGNLELRRLSAVHEALSRFEVAATLNQVDAALERLVDMRNILERTRDGYDFAVSAFPLIIAQSARLSDWINLRREVFARAGDIAPEMAPPELQGRLW